MTAVGMTPGEKVARLLRPRSIAIAGATEDLGKIVGRMLPVLLDGGYRGRIYPVNPKYATVRGLQCFPSLAAIPDEVDHCIIAVPRERVAAVLRDCREKGVHGASIFSSGYAEAGEAGRAAQADLRALAGGMVFIGPNCMGFANLIDRVVATGSSVIHHDSSPGDVALLTQSGGLGFATFGYLAQQAGIRFSHAVNTGNSAGVSYADLVEFLYDDPSTRVIVALTEDERTVGELVAAVRRRGPRKPIVLLKLGRGATGMRMALSHTGALAGDYRLGRDVAEQHGIVCVESVEEAIAAADLARHGIDGTMADGIGAMSISGGNVTALADEADLAGLEFPELAPRTANALRTALPDYISIHNPVDLTSYAAEDPSVHVRVADILREDPSIRLVVTVLTTIPDYTGVCRLLADHRRESGRPMVVLWTGGAYEDRSPGILQEAGIPIVRSAAVLCRTLVRMTRAARAAQMARGAQPGNETSAASPPVPTLLTADRGTLTESRSMTLLREAGLATPRTLVANKADLRRAAVEVGFPIVLKSDLVETHISDRGGVIVDLRGTDDLERCRERIAAMPGDRLIVSQFLPGSELVASTFHHPHFGLVMMIGSGGVMVELHDDVRFVCLPASSESIAGALAATAVGRALKKGHRGAVGFDAACRFLERLGAFALAAGTAVAQIELNPITVGSHGAAAVDASITLA